MPREKTYSASSGFVYQYRFVSHESQPDGDRYRFATTHNRSAACDVVVHLPARALQSWEMSEDRALTPALRYAIAKMALFAGFDEAARPDQIPQPIVVGGGQVRNILEVLDI